MAKSSTSFKPGQVANPKGAPKRGESWAELFNTIGNLTPAEVAKRAKHIARKLKDLPQGVTLKELTVINVYAALLSGEINARLLKEAMERAEGKVPERIEGAGENGEHIVRFIDESKSSNGDN